MLGAAVGGRPDDFEASGAPFEGRGRRIEEMLDDMKRIWAGEERGFAGAIGPDVSANPPRILVGGQVDAAFRRAAEYGDGWISGGGPPEMFGDSRAKVDAAFRDAGRSERPTASTLSYFSLDADPESQAQATLGDYYSFMPEYAGMVVASAVKSEDEVKERARMFARAGLRRADLLPLLLGSRAGGQAGGGGALRGLSTPPATMAGGCLQPSSL